MQSSDKLTGSFRHSDMRAAGIWKLLKRLDAGTCSRRIEGEYCLTESVSMRSIYISITSVAAKESQLVDEKG